MAVQSERFRPPLHHNYSYPSLPGLEIAVPPKHASSSTDIMAYYMRKALPLPPPVRTPDTSPSGEQSDSVSVKRPKKKRITVSAAARNAYAVNAANAANELPGKFEELTIHVPYTNSKRIQEKQIPGDEPKISDLSNGVDHIKIAIPPIVVDPDSSTLSRSTQTETSKSTDEKRRKKSDSAYSFNSVSVYSQDNVLEDIVSGYSEWGSWAPSIASTNSPTKSAFYLQPGTYSASASELGSGNRTSDVPREIRSFRHKSRPSLSSLGGLNGVKDHKRVVTLDNLVMEERERLAKEIQAHAARLSDPGNPELDDMGYAVADSGKPKNPSWSVYNDLVRSLEVQPLAMTQKSKTYPASVRSESRFSDHSSTSEGGVIASARDSVISHIRNIPSAFKTSNRPSMIFKEKSSMATIQIESPPHLEKDKSWTLQKENGKHPLKSPFPFLTPLSKKARVDEDPNSLHPNFARRSWDAIKHRSSLRPSPIVQSNVISNAARHAGGPDTPLPNASSFNGPKSPTGVSHKASFLHDAMHKAKNVTKVKSKEDRRRDKLRKTIVVIGTADQTPNGDVASWL